MHSLRSTSLSAVHFLIVSNSRGSTKFTWSMENLYKWKVQSHWLIQISGFSVPGVLLFACRFQFVSFSRNQNRMLKAKVVFNNTRFNRINNQNKRKGEFVRSSSRIVELLLLAANAILFRKCIHMLETVISLNLQFFPCFSGSTRSQCMQRLSNN